MEIKRVTEKDAAELLEIYAPYVRDTAISFEYAVPSVEEFSERIVNISSRYPYIKAVKDGKIIGYAYAGAFKGRAAYDWSVETTIYIRMDCRRTGVGRALYEVLEKALRDMGILNMNACIAKPNEDEAGKPVECPYLTDDSIRFHGRMGFSEVGCFHNSGYKFNQWFHMIWMEKMLGEHKADAQPVKFGQWTIE